MPKTIEQVEKEMIFEALRRHNNNRNAAARELGVSPATIRNKLARYGVKFIREVVVPLDGNSQEVALERYETTVKLKD